MYEEVLSDVDESVLADLCARLTLEEKVLLLTGRDSWSTHPLPSIGLRSMVLSDGPAGVRGATWDERSPSVNFPSPSALAASWDRTVVRAVGEQLGREAARKGVDVVLAPTINIQRSPYGGRHFEAFSEDPLVTSELAAAYVAGIQSQAVGATAKHYVANDSETDRFTVDVQVDERSLREVYLRAFEGPVIDGGAWLVMSAYNSVNGARATENELLRSPLEDDWGFDGVVVSDWTAVRSLQSAQFPQDLVMPGPSGPWGDALVRAVRAGEIDERIVDRKVIRMLRLAGRVGAIDGVAASPITEVSTDARATARVAATAGSVLLRNEAILPLAAPASIALVGEGMRHPRTQGGGSATVIPAEVVTPLGAVTARFPDSTTTWSLGAVVGTGLSDLPLDSFHAPDGTPGMQVVYLNQHGEILASETRRASEVVSFEAESLALRSAVIELRLAYRPEDQHPTEFPFGVAGLCDFEVFVDGALAHQGRLRTGPGDDPAAAVLHPPSTSFLLPRAGEEVAITVRLRPVEGGIPDALSFRVGLPPRDDDPDALIAQAVSAAAAAEIAVVMVSTSPEVESEGFDRTTLALPGRQDDLVHAVAAANPHTIVIVNAGSPVLMPWVDDVAAVLAMWFPGQEVGAALADMLSGDAEPGGRLAVTWPADEQSVPVSNVTPDDGRLAYTEGIHVGYRAWLRTDATPAFEFGFGLGYGQWALTDANAPERASAGSDVDLSVTLANTGSRMTKAVVQVYVERVETSSIDRPERWLAAFKATGIPAAESRHLRITVPARAFATWTADGWVTEPGEYRLVIGTSVAKELQSIPIRLG
ncbi:beta-glucosidase family protein [Microbacterium terricola]|uniref:Glycosyl hydrolase n=1 Tax=Microbacterium terricola TaxID=344163 RepID=A0ABM8E3B0_9MICO|nr:glycoside hydrolase family 3 C-terminal domain-containing protein [Microbacterium terricola]UYK40023.1 glycoside hydrolase family 3 C-terminal domain-containing protein [Microbacterium terricola]BDV32285.1 glycosyl hydrolase [Microbacterium terricola]